MRGKSIYNHYSSAYIHQPEGDRPERWFIFYKNLLLVRQTAVGPQVPYRTSVEGIAGLPEERHYLGTFDDDDCFTLDVGQMIELPAGYEFVNLRALAADIDDDMFMLAGRAAQILHWDRQSRFCGSCGKPTSWKEDERAKKCGTCGNVIYPRISPAIITAIIRDDRILLAHNRNFPANRYSVIAGFMEPGEEFEDTIEREVFEEVSIRVKNLRYFASQSWPFPDSLMVGFVCEYADGEIKVDGVEIDDADWFSRDNLPDIPNTTSIAGRMIQWFREGADESLQYAARR
jgi:NAD+ diphosphatase